MDGLNELIDKHFELDYVVEKEGKPFISDWNCDHPYYGDYFGNIQITNEQVKNYNYIRSDELLLSLISNFHYKNDKKEYLPNEIIIGNGSAAIISAFFIWLKLQKVEFVYYIPPVYHTIHFYAKIFNIPLRPVSKDQLLNPKAKLNLPKNGSILIFTDPIWYAGCSVNDSFITQIINWQKTTNSMIFIDGSFQYFKWNFSKKENSANFDPDLTFRLLSPSKIVAVHGLRFAYILLPKKWFKDFDLILDNLSGSSNGYDVEFAKLCMSLLISSNSNNDLIQYCQNIYSNLINKEIISSSIQPNSGYFVFAKLNKFNDGYIAMDGNILSKTNMWTTSG